MRTLACLAAVAAIAATAAAPDPARAAAPDPEPARAAAPGPDPARDAAVVESLVHGVPLADFARGRAAWRRAWPWLDWSTDGCSAPLLGDRGRTFDFAWACRRHDFAYRNLRRLGPPHWSAAARDRADARFLEDMRGSCAARRASQRAGCERWAAVYHGAVRALGGP